MIARREYRQTFFEQGDDLGVARHVRHAEASVGQPQSRTHQKLGSVVIAGGDDDTRQLGGAAKRFAGRRVTAGALHLS